MLILLTMCDTPSCQGIRDVLLTHGVPGDRITTDWKGESQPVASNDTEEGRSQNRRTEITLTPVSTTQ
jgi:outer membrane protein OmpA-like peptidoglycan-associated protein